MLQYSLLQSPPYELPPEYYNQSQLNFRHVQKMPTKPKLNSPQTVAVCHPLKCAFGCPGVPSPAIGPTGESHPARGVARDWLGIAPDYGSDQLWPRRMWEDSLECAIFQKLMR